MVEIVINIEIMVGLCISHFIAFGKQNNYLLVTKGSSIISKLFCLIAM